MTDSPRDSRPETAAQTSTLLLTGARLVDGRTVDVRISGPRIEAVGTAGSLDRTATGGRAGRQQQVAARIDLRGYLLLPAPAEPHAHLDLALTASGPPSGDSEDVQRRAVEAALLHLGHGTTAVRSHVRIGDVQGLGGLEAVLAARRALRDLVEVQAVAVPRLLTGAAGADGYAMLRDALKMGAQAVGGCPDLDPDPSGYVEAVLTLAAEHGVPVDLHTAADDPARLARLAAMAGGMRPGVAIGPCQGLGGLPPSIAAAAAERLAAAGVAVVALPQGGCAGVEPGGGRAAGPVAGEATAAVGGRGAGTVLGFPAGGGEFGAGGFGAGEAPGLDGPGFDGPGFDVPGPSAPAYSAPGFGTRPGTPPGSASQSPWTGRGAVAPVRVLRAAGVRVCAGSGALGDLANPVGRADPLEAAFLLASHGACGPLRAYDLVSGQARAAMGLPEVRVEAGFPAELLAVRGQTVAGVLSLAYSRLVVHGGRVVSRTSAVREFCDSSGEPALDLPRQAPREA